VIIISQLLVPDKSRTAVSAFLAAARTTWCGIDTGQAVDNVSNNQGIDLDQ